MSEIKTKKEIIKFTYFKESGKYYDEVEVVWDVEAQVYESEHQKHKGQQFANVLMFKLCDRIREMQRNNEPLPGLNGGWKGIILLTGENCVPQLLTPLQSE